jgi:hypothetical protein
MIYILSATWEAADRAAEWLGLAPWNGYPSWRWVIDANSLRGLTTPKVLLVGDYWNHPSFEAIQMEMLVVQPSVRKMESFATIDTVRPPVVGEWHDYIATNLHECILDPTPEESDRILRESAVELDVRVQQCTRPAPHVCTKNGPCTGWPR